MTKGRDAAFRTTVGAASAALLTARFALRSHNRGSLALASRSLAKSYAKKPSALPSRRSAPRWSRLGPRSLSLAR
jgi:hypothetical protein